MYKKNKLKLITKFFNIGLLLIIPTLILTSCGAPQSQKYLTLVAQFDPLLRLPNPNLDNEQEKKFKDATMQVHYSLLKKVNSRNFIQ